jgi:hypothetical protein
MAKKLNVPSITGMDTGNLSYGVNVYLQSVQDALNTLDVNTVYKDSVSVNITNPRLRALSAQGQAFSIGGTSAASGDDYAVLVSNVKTMLEDLNSLRTQVADLVKQIKGT